MAPRRKKLSKKAIQELRERMAQANPDMLFMHGFEKALVGVAERCGQHSLACYDWEKCIEVLVEDGGLSYEDAQDYFSYNCAGAWMGEHTPIILYPIPEG